MFLVSVHRDHIEQVLAFVVPPNFVSWPLDDGDYFEVAWDFQKDTPEGIEAGVRQALFEVFGDILIGNDDRIKH